MLGTFCVHQNNISLLGYTCEPDAVIVFAQMYVCRARSPNHHTWCQYHSIEKMTFTEISGQPASMTSMFLSRVVVWGEAALEAGGITTQNLTLRCWASVRSGSFCCRLHSTQQLCRDYSYTRCFPMAEGYLVCPLLFYIL